MEGKVFLLVGMPGTGKTTLARTLIKRISPLKVFAFGQMLFEAARLNFSDLQYDQFRTYPSKYCTAHEREIATRLLLDEIDESRVTSNILLDSHPVTADDYGFRAIPHNASFLERFRPDAIILLLVSHEVTARRIEQEPEGRRPAQLGDLAIHEQLQNAAVMAYSVVSGCPVYAINTDQSIDDIVNHVLHIFRIANADYKLIQDQYEQYGSTVL